MLIVIVTFVINCSALFFQPAISSLCEYVTSRVFNVFDDKVVMFAKRNRRVKRNMGHNFGADLSRNYAAALKDDIVIRNVGRSQHFGAT